MTRTAHAYLNYVARRSTSCGECYETNIGQLFLLWSMQFYVISRAHISMISSIALWENEDKDFEIFMCD